MYNTGQALIEGSPLSIPLSSYWRQLTAVVNFIEKIMACASVSDTSEDSGVLSSRTGWLTGSAWLPFIVYLCRISVLWWTLLQGHHSAKGKTCIGSIVYQLQSSIHFSHYLSVYYKRGGSLCLPLLHLIWLSSIAYISVCMLLSVMAVKRVSPCKYEEVIVW